MTLLTHQFRGSYPKFPRSSLWRKGVNFKQQSTRIHMISRSDVCFSVKRNLCLSVDACAYGPAVKLLKLSAFKSSAQYNESDGRSNGSKIFKNSLKVAYVPKESEETAIDASTLHSVCLSNASETDEKILGYHAIHRLFQKWLNILRRQSSSQVVDKIIRGPSPSEEFPKTQNTSQNNEIYGILKGIWCQFLRLDAIAKVSILIFIPLYFAVSVIHGAEVTKDLTPLWILGPLCITFYVKLIQLLWALYVFSFNQIVKAIKNLPWYHQMAYSSIMQGKIKDGICVHIFKNLDYKQVLSKRGDIEVWLTEKHLDFVESIWPFYCRTIRFLKQAI